MSTASLSWHWEHIRWSEAFHASIMQLYSDIVQALEACHALLPVPNDVAEREDTAPGRAKSFLESGDLPLDCSSRKTFD